MHTLSASKSSGEHLGDGNLVDVFAALANRDRLAIVDALWRSRAHGRPGMAIAEVARELDITRFAASRHLGILHDAGLVETHHEGKRLVSVLRTERLMDVWDWIDRIDSSTTDVAAPRAWEQPEPAVHERR